MSKPAVPATPLPWVYEFGEREWVRGPNNQPIFGGHYTGHGRKHGPRKPNGHVAQDMKFIVEACNAYPRLIEERERLRESLSSLLDTIAPTPIVAEVQNNLEGQSTFNVRFADIAKARTALASLEKNNG